MAKKVVKKAASKRPAKTSGRAARTSGKKAATRSVKQASRRKPVHILKAGDPVIVDDGDARLPETRAGAGGLVIDQNGHKLTGLNGGNHGHANDAFTDGSTLEVWVKLPQNKDLTRVAVRDLKKQSIITITADGSSGNGSFPTITLAVHPVLTKSLQIDDSDASQEEVDSAGYTKYRLAAAGSISLVTLKQNGNIDPVFDIRKYTGATRTRVRVTGHD